LAAVEYEIRVAGAVPDDILGGLTGVQVLIQPLTSTLTGVVPDLAALHGLINRLQGAGLPLVELYRPAKGPRTAGSSSAAASDDS